MPIPGLKTRQPTGAVPYPCILLEGEEKAGKTWQAALLSASDKVGETYWIDVSEGAADEYGVIPGVRYQIVEHDGSYQQILAAVTAVKAEAKRAAAAGEKPVVLVIDTGSALWEGLREWVDQRARNSKAGKRALAADPDAEVKGTTNLWNDARGRWYKIINQLLTFPGIAIVTARGREVSVIGKDGQPVPGEKTWKPATQEQFPYDVNVWVRMFRDDTPIVVGARSAHLGIVPGKDAERKITDPKSDGRLLEWLIFDALKCDPTKVVTRDMPALSMGELSEEERVTQDKEEGQPEPVAAQQRTSRQRPTQPRATRTPEQWATEVANTKIPDQVYALHRAATAQGQLTEDLDKLMRARVEEMGKAAVAAHETAAETPQAAAPATEATTEVDEEAARIAAEEAALTESEQRGMLLDELAEQVKIMAAPNREAMTHRKLPEGVDAASTEKLQEVIAGFRKLVIAKLRSTGRTEEAVAYAKVKPEEFDTLANLFGRDGEPLAQSA